jgi:uncharacterized protein (DUF885 family)
MNKESDGLNQLITEYWDHTLSRNPEFASIIGDMRWNRLLTDYSEQAIDNDLEVSKQFLSRAEKIQTESLNPQDRLNKRLIVRDLAEKLECARYREWEMPLNQIDGIHINFPQLISLLQFNNVKDYEDLIARMNQFPAQVDQTMDLMRRGVSNRLVLPQFVMQKVIDQVEALASCDPEKSVFMQPISNFTTLKHSERDRIASELLKLVRESVIPSYRKLLTFLKQEYAPKGREEAGLWSLPDGEGRYRAAIRNYTTTDLSPDEIHELGLLEVDRIEREMLAIARQLNFSNLKSFNHEISLRPELRARSREHILDLYRQYTDQMREQLPLLFGRLPKADVVVEPVQEYREQQSAAAEYHPGTPDGSRPGRILVNTANPTSRKIIGYESTAYHEGLPGHHLQISIAQEIPSLPQFRQHARYTAYIEGWALYSETLGKDVGFYKDPYNEYGHLQDEILRAIRLVVDTGIHHKRWKREMVVQYFRDHSAIDEMDIQSETDRYVVWPAQALAYKLGQLKILQLREKARKELGPGFDIRDFHDEILANGALPLDLLESEINRWVTTRKS